MEDNWYERQRAEERKSSAWDLDGRANSASVVRQEHEEHCDSQEVADYHRSEEHDRGVGTGEITSLIPTHRSSIWFAVAFVNVFVSFFLLFLEVIPPTYAIGFFLLLNPGIFIVIAFYGGDMKRAEQSYYWLFVVIFEIFMYVKYLLGGR